MSGFVFVRNVWFRFCTKGLVSFLYEMSGFVFVRNVWFRFCTKCLVSLLYEMSGFAFVRNVWFRFCTKCLVSVLYEMSGFVIVRNIWFRFCTKYLVSFLYEMSGFVFVRNVWFRFCTKCLVLVFVRDVVCTNCRAPTYRVDDMNENKTHKNSFCWLTNSSMCPRFIIIRLSERKKKRPCLFWKPRSGLISLLKYSSPNSTDRNVAMITCPQ